jgi:hypothetical protein
VILTRISEVGVSKLTQINFRDLGKIFKSTTIKNYISKVQCLNNRHLYSEDYGIELLVVTDDALWNKLTIATTIVDRLRVRRSEYINTLITIVKSTDLTTDDIKVDRYHRRYR